jgi:deazaflavin-dependent oxidoreductase (nitroreductase family)
MALIGSKRLKMTTVIHHRGRRSGRPYATPTSARPTADGFVVPLTFGPQADWYRNMQAAGGCVIEWNGVEYPVVQPEVVGWATARTAFTRGERVVLRLMGMDSFVRLRNAPADGSDPT